MFMARTSRLGLRNKESSGRGLRLPNALLERVDRLVAATGLTWSQIAREGIERLLDDTERQGYLVLRLGGKVQTVELRNDAGQ